MRPRCALVGVCLLNVIDALLTLVLSIHGLIHEANPIMRAFLRSSPEAFLAAKFVLVYGGVAFLWRNHDARLVRRGCYLTLVVYLLVMVQHARVIRALLSEV